MSEPHQKEKHPNEPSSSSHIVEGVREVVYSAIEQALHHGAAHLMEHEGKALLKVLKEPYLGTSLLRPHSAWWWRYATGLETAGKILGSRAFGIATELLKDSDSLIHGKEERRMVDADIREAHVAAEREARIAAAREPKIEQGIVYKNGSVYFPVSRQWILPPVIITPSHSNHSSSHSRHTPHPKASLHVDVEVVGNLNSLAGALRISVQQPAHFRRNQILIKATPISIDRGISNHGERLDRLGNLVDLFLNACAYPPKPKI